MSVVNTDSESLLTALQNMRTAISSIESTKRTLSQKYQQLGQGWSDRKYLELGYIVYECSKSFTYLSSILQKGEKTVAQLVKSIQTYENEKLEKEISCAPIQERVTLRQEDVIKFKDGNYTMRTLDKPMIVYRYFGAYSYNEMLNIIEDSTNNDSTRIRDICYRELGGPSNYIDIERNDSYGSSAAGCWLTTFRSNNANDVRERTALLQIWGNSAEYVAEIELPVGTVIAEGVAASQGNSDEILAGGANQIYLHSLPYGDQNHLMEYLLMNVQRIGRTEDFDFNFEE